MAQVAQSKVVYPMPGVQKDVIVVPRGNGAADDRNTIANGNDDPLALLVEWRMP